MRWNSRILQIDANPSVITSLLNKGKRSLENGLSSNKYENKI
jgi:hypothetical protein